MSTKKLLLFLLLAVFFVSLPTVTFAQTLPDGYTDAVTVAPATSGYYVTSLGGLITAGIKWVAYIGGVLLLIYLVWGGAEWIMSGGDKAKVESGRTRITQSIIGFAILACIFVGYAAVLDFLGLRSKVGIGNIGAGGTAGSGGGGGPTNPPGSGSSCTTATVNQYFNDGGAGGYCSGGGAAQVRCVPAGVGGLNYPHFEPCSCLNGSTLLPGVDVRGCQ